MNLNDIFEAALELENNTVAIENIAIELKNCLNLKLSWEDDCIKTLLFEGISGQYEPSVSNSRNLEINSDMFFKNFKEELTKINFMDFWMALTKIDEKFNIIINTSQFKQSMEEGYITIHHFISSKQKKENIQVEYNAVLEAIENIIKNSNDIKERIKTIKHINFKLNNGIIENTLKIRLLNQDNMLDDTIESLKNIKEIYSALCIMMNISEKDNKIKYSRIESGSFFMNLIGNPVVLSTLGGIIAFSYKVYNDHFSTKAKQEKILGALKIRGEMHKLIKESSPEIIKDEEAIKNSLSKVETATINLFINSPCIKINGEKIGEDNINTEKVIKFIEESKNRIE